MIMLKSTHEREMAKLRQERDDAREVADQWYAISKSDLAKANILRSANADLRAKLDRFTGPRARDAKGHFVAGAGK